MEEYFDDAEVENLYHWIDRIPLSRPKKNIVKDFSDGGMLYRSSCIRRRCICMHLSLNQTLRKFVDLHGILLA
jgi:hypothetical protein